MLVTQEKSPRFGFIFVGFLDQRYYLMHSTIEDYAWVLQVIWLIKIIFLL